MRYGHSLSAALMLSLFFLLPTWGDVPDAPPLGACYMGYGKMLEAAQSRQLSLNAHLGQFLYQPGGLEIAYEGSQRDGDEITQFIRLVGVKHGATTMLASTTAPIGADGNVAADAAQYSLGGWSGDGRYLLLLQERFVEGADPSNNYFSKTFKCVDVGADPIRVSSIPLPDAGTLDVMVRETRSWWSPDRSRLLFAMQGLVKQREKRQLQNVVAQTYDPKTGKTQDVVVGDRQTVRGWLDSTHLLVDDSLHLTEYTPSGKVHYASYDVNAGTQGDIPAPVKMPARSDDFEAAPMNTLSPKAAYLRLEDEPHHIQDQQKVSAVDAHTLWVRRTQGPKFQSAAPVGVTPNKDDPQAVWSPTGAQIAFIAHGDLFVTDLTMRDATVGEKYAAGEKLDCQEERQLAESNLKQVGLALLQYNQDFDEQFPPADHWQDSVKPYFGPDILLSIEGHPVVYHTPANLSLASIDSPEDTVLGTVDLPCATVTLYVDGHVKALPKVMNQPTP